MDTGGQVRDIDLARWLEPEVTTVHIPAEHIGAAAVEALIAWLHEGSRQVPEPVIPLPLVIRGSTAAPSA